ncbi:MAG: hypothetical protein OYH77_03910 [Pseudomonadota bacterium]|nr:hypothetical protein [Pseudomonadota bacterium]
MPQFKQIALKECKEAINKFSTNATGLSGELFAFLAQDNLLKWLGKLTESTATIYDKALDAEYLKTHIGGGDHRLFDGGHDIFNAWTRVKDASHDDSFQQEVLGYVSALWKDVTTVKGLPFTTVSKENFEAWIGKLDWIPGVDRKYLYDLCSFDAFEILSVALGAVAVVFALKKKDQKKLAEILGSMSIIAIISANPVMGIFIIATACYAYKKKSMEFDKVAFGKSAAVSIFSMALFGVLGLPVLLQLTVVIVASALFKTQVLDNAALHKFIKEDIFNEAKENMAEIRAFASDIYENIGDRAKGKKKTQTEAS